MAVGALARNRLRTALTTLGIATGIAATLCTVALGEGSAAAIHEDLVALGDNLLWVQASVIRAGGVRDRAGGTAATLTPEDSQAIALEVPEITRCTPQVDSPIQVIRGNQNWRTTYRGVTADYVDIRKWPVERGRSVHRPRCPAAIEGLPASARLWPTWCSATTTRWASPCGSDPCRLPCVGVLKAKGQSSARAGPGRLHHPSVYHGHRRCFRRTASIEDIMCSATSADAIATLQKIT